MVVDEDSRRLRRVEFILRMAGYLVISMPHDREAANWLMNNPELKVAALVLMEHHAYQYNGALAENIAARNYVPVVFVATDNRLDAGSYVDMAYGGKSWCIKTTELCLLEVLENILKLKTIKSGESNAGQGSESDWLRADALFADGSDGTRGA